MEGLQGLVLWHADGRGLCAGRQGASQACPGTDPTSGGTEARAGPAQVSGVRGQGFGAWGCGSLWAMMVRV